MGQTTTDNPIVAEMPEVIVLYSAGLALQEKRVVCADPQRTDALLQTLEHMGIRLRNSTTRFNDSELVVVMATGRPHNPRTAFQRIAVDDLVELLALAGQLGHEPSSPPLE